MPDVVIKFYDENSILARESAAEASAAALTAAADAVAAVDTVLDAAVADAVAAILAADGQGVFPAAGHRLIVEGSSKPQVGGGGSAMSYLFWALSRAPVKIAYDYTLDNLAISGGTTGTESALGNNWNTVPYPVGMLHPTRIALRDARIAAGADVCILDNGTNDVPSLTSDQTMITNVKTWHASARVAGLRRLILLSLDPRGGASTTVQKIIASHNRALEEYADANADVDFVNYASLMLIADNSGYLPAANVLTDGVHEGAPTNYRKAPQLSTALARVAPPREVSDFGAETYDATTGRRNNALLNGGFAGTTGTNNFAGTTSGNVPTDWESGGSATGMTLAWGGDVAWAEGNTRYGRSDLLARRLTISGSTAADGSFFLRQNRLLSAMGLVVGDKLLPRLGVQLTGVTGLQSIGITITSNAGSGIVGAWGRAGNYLAVNVLPQLDGFFLIQFPDAITVPVGATELGFRAEVLNRAGQVVAGTIDFVFAGLSKLDTLP